MKEPERWLTARSGRDRRLLLAALAEVPTQAAWERTRSRLGQFGVSLAATSTASGLASASVASTSALKAFFKAMLMGVGVGGVVVMGAQLAQHSGESSPPAAEQASVLRETKVASISVEHHTVAASSWPPPSKTPSDNRSRLRVTDRAAPIDPVELSMSGTEDRQAGVASRDSAAPESARATPASPRTEAGPVLPIVASRSLEREVTAIAAARQALKRGDAQATMRELARLDEVGGFRSLTQEAALLRVEALVVSGQAEAAVALARQLLASGIADAHRGRLEQLANGKPHMAE